MSNIDVTAASSGAVNTTVAQLYPSWIDIFLANSREFQCVVFGHISRFHAQRSQNDFFLSQHGTQMSLCVSTAYTHFIASTNERKN